MHSITSYTYIYSHLRLSSAFRKALCQLLFCLIGLTPLVAQQLSDNVLLYNSQNELVHLNDKAVVIVCTQLNCRGCFDYLKKLKKHCPDDVEWYCLFDYTRLSISQRQNAIGNLESFIKIPGLTYLFIEEKAPQTFRNTLKLCQSDHTPHLILVSKEKYASALCHELLFSVDANDKEIQKTIRQYFK